MVNLILLLNAAAMIHTGRIVLVLELLRQAYRSSQVQKMYICPPIHVTSSSENEMKERKRRILGPIGNNEATNETSKSRVFSYSYCVCEYPARLKTR